MSKRILIVDDEPRYARLLEANLRTEGYEVATAHDGLEALDAFSSQPIDLVLLDVMMPRLDPNLTLPKSYHGAQGRSAGRCTVRGRCR